MHEKLWPASEISVLSDSGRRRYCLFACEQLKPAHPNISGVANICTDEPCRTAARWPKHIPPSHSTQMSRSHLNFCVFWLPSDLNFSCWLLKSFIQWKPVAAWLDRADNSRKSKITILAFMAFQSKSFLPKYSCFSLASCSPWASRLSIMASPSWAFFQVLGRADTKQTM